MRPRAKLNPYDDSHVWCVYYRREARGLSPLHMGHCIVMSEALLVVVGCCSSGGSHRIGTYSHFEMSRLARPPPLPSMPGDMI